MTQNEINVLLLEGFQGVSELQTATLKVMIQHWERQAGITKMRADLDQMADSHEASDLRSQLARLELNYNEDIAVHCKQALDVIARQESLADMARAAVEQLKVAAAAG